MFNLCEENKIKVIRLHSTITAHSFYKKIGFVDCAPMKSILINNVEIRSIPMIKSVIEEEYIN